MNANIGGWGDEERDFEGDFPFDNDQYFDIIFVCTAEKYHVCFLSLFIIKWREVIFCRG